MLPAKGLQRKRNIKEILIEGGLVSEDKLKTAEELAKKEGKQLQQTLVEMKLVDDLKLLKVLADEWGFKAVDLSKL